VRKVASIKGQVGAEDASLVEADHLVERAAPSSSVIAVQRFLRAPWSVGSNRVTSNTGPGAW